MAIPHRTFRQSNSYYAHYPATFFVCALTFAHRFFAAFAMAALPAADKTRFFGPMTSRSAEPPNAVAAARTLFN
jgi:hypothetical protein